MIALEITSLKTLMGQLLAGDTFDSFLLEEASINAGITYTIDGRINLSFYSEDELSEGICPFEFQSWKTTKQIAFEMIKGDHTPTAFHFVLQLNPTSAAKMLQKEAPDQDFSQVKALALIIRYDGTQATITTGTSYRTFILSKDADLIWDKAVQTFLSAKGIPYNLL